MYFTLAVSAADPDTCAALTLGACAVDARAMPVPGPARVEWRAPDGRAALIRWGATPCGPGHPHAGPGSHAPACGPAAAAAAAGEAVMAVSHAGTIWVSDHAAGSVSAGTGITRIDPVYLARARGAVIVSDRATWAAATAGRLGDADPILYGALLSLGYPLGAATPFAGVRALGPGTSCRASAGAVTEGKRAALAEPGPGGAPGAARVAEALVQAVAPLRDRPGPVELSLTGGKDSRLIAAALISAGVPVRARTYGFPGHPDVVVAALVARELGIEHTIAQPRTAGEDEPGGRPAVQEVDVLGRLRATVLVADGMLSAFENVGRPDPGTAAAQVVVGGHGGELLRGGYAKIIPGSAARRAAVSAEQLRRLSMRRVPLLRARWRTAYLAGLAPWLTAVAARPQVALDDFYLVNRAGRWSAAARQAYSIRSAMIQPFFDEHVVRAARSVPLAERLDERLVRGAIGALCPPLLDIPLAADRWKCDPKPAPGPAGPPDGSGPADAGSVTASPGQQRARFDWRRGYGDEVAGFLRDYVIDVGSAGGLFTVISRPAAERLLQPPHTDPVTVWALATLAALISQDWLNARTPAGRVFAIQVPV
jgi:hypothetical protein